MYIRYPMNYKDFHDITSIDIEKIVIWVQKGVAI